jgi:ferric-chelate reductase (NADPH)
MPSRRSLKKSSSRPRASRTSRDKIRIKIGALLLRTYTPLSWNTAEGSARLLAWLPGRGPGSEWASAVKVGQSFSFKGPEKSLKLAEAAGNPVIFFGDETAVGAAAALRLMRPLDKTLRFLFELGDPEEAQVALIALGMVDAVRLGKGDGQLETARRQILEWAGELQNPRIFLVGNQESVKDLKAKLQEKLPNAKIKAKVYWREGKAGLD